MYNTYIYIYMNMYILWRYKPSYHWVGPSSSNIFRNQFLDKGRVGSYTHSME